MTDGLVVVDKPRGWTSHDVIARCRRIFGQRRVGHAGTLDPDATGVLLVGLGRATRLLQFLTGLPKVYTGRLVLGAATTTLDAAGDVIETWDMAGVGLDAARAVAASLTGDIEQVPPMVSALKVEGRRLHALARQGVVVERTARPVTVTRFDLAGPVDVGGRGRDPALGRSGHHPALGRSGPGFDFVVACSSGTYVRTLAADLGTALGGGAYLSQLRRQEVGPFVIGEAVALEDLGPDAVIAPAGAMRGFAAVRVDEATAAAVGHGRVLDRDRLGVEGSGPWSVLDGSGDLLAVYRDRGDGAAAPAVVLAAR